MSNYGHLTHHLNSQLSGAAGIIARLVKYLDERIDSQAAGMRRVHEETEKRLAALEAQQKPYFERPVDFAIDEAPEPYQFHAHVNTRTWRAAKPDRFTIEITPDDPEIALRGLGDLVGRRICITVTP